MCTRTCFIMSYRAAQQSAVECISQTATKPFARCVHAKPFLGKCYFSFKKVCANIPPKPLLAVSEIHSTRLRWLGRDDTDDVKCKHTKQPHLPALNSPTNQNSPSSRPVFVLPAGLRQAPTTKPTTQVRQKFTICRSKSTNGSQNAQNFGG